MDVRLEFVKPSDDCVLRREIGASDPTRSITVEWVPLNGSMTLTGAPSSYFNSPGQGGTLVGTFDVPSSGETTYSVSVSDGAQSIDVDVKVKKL